jgi:hypothetical protein
MNNQCGWVDFNSNNHCFLTSTVGNMSLNNVDLHLQTQVVFSFHFLRWSFFIDSCVYSLQLEKRTFQTLDFYRERQDDITPAGLAFFQSDWDVSVTDFFHDTLSKYWETIQWIIWHYDLFSQIVHLKKAMSKWMFFCFNASFICKVWKECKIVAM